MIRGRCTEHPQAQLQCPVCNGQKTSAAKKRSSRQNAKKGGRPPGKEKI